MTKPYKFAAPVTAEGNNRVNTQGVALPDKRNRTSNTFNQTVAPGQVLPISCTGTQFYVLFTSAPISIRPSRGTFNSYNTGQGLRLDDETAFNQIELWNTTASTIVVSVFVGYQEFIDQTLILNNVTNPNVAYPTFPTANAAAVVNINDLSGQKFTDINGKNWYAISRVAILVFNTDSGATYLIQKSGSAVSNGPAIAAVFPLTAIRLDTSGNYTMATGGGNINVIVSEIYNAIPATS
jgi:hypothetical protein